MTRFTSRAWKRKLSRPSASLTTLFPGLIVQFPDSPLTLLLASCAEIQVPDPSFRVVDVHGRPVVVVEGAPHRVVGVEGDRIVDALDLRGPADVVGLALERELRRVDADNDQALIRVLVVPRADITERAQPVDARIRPEVDEHDLPAQALRGERLGV